MWRGRRAAQAGLVSVVVTCLVLAFCPSLVSAESGEIPPFTGSMGFKNIAGPEGPEEFSWRVHLNEGQDLRQVDDQHAAVYFTEQGWFAGTITAVAAHDAHGTSVPTTLAVVGIDVITLTVHHRAGNPAVGGSPFVYPVIAGEGWEGGFQTHIVTGPPDEQELKEEQERIAREKQEALEKTWPKAGPRQCVVPRLKGKSLRAAKRLLREAKCLNGGVRKLGDATARSGKVVRQVPRPGTSSELWTPVRLTLGVLDPAAG